MQTLRAVLGTLLFPGLVACNTDEYAAAAVVRGTVRDAEGAPVEGIRVRATAFMATCDGIRLGGDVGMPQPVTDAAGRYLLRLSLPQIAPGPACVKVLVDGERGHAEGVAEHVELRDALRAHLDTATVDLQLMTQ